MPVLIVEEGGKRRAFRVGDGSLSVGSGPDAKLTLSGGGVAEHHLDLVVEGERVRVRPRPGVLPPDLGGAALEAEAELPPGVRLVVGEASIYLGAEGGTAAPAASPPAAPRAARGRGAAAGGAARRSRRSVPSNVPQPGRDRAVVKGRSRPRKRAGIPPALTVTLVLGALGIAAFALLKGYQRSLEGAQQTAATVLLRQAEQQLELQNADQVEDYLRRIGSPDELSEADRRRYRKLEEGIVPIREARRVAQWNAVGDDFFENRLEKYEQAHLEGDPSDAKIRVFLKYCAEFRERWPQHPRLDWVDRRVQRFAGAVDTGAEPTLEDVEWEVEVLTDAKPRDYAAAFELLEGYREQASALEQRRLRFLVGELEQERELYHEDRLVHAQGKYDMGKKSEAVEWLVQSIIGLGDAEMADEAARKLLSFPEADSYLRGYRSNRPDVFERLTANARVAEAARGL